MLRTSSNANISPARKVAISPFILTQGQREVAEAYGLCRLKLRARRPNLPPRKTKVGSLPYFPLTFIILPFFDGFLSQESPRS